jgi:hypothetical protein
MRCSGPPWQCSSAYSCSHSSTAGAFQLGVAWPLSLQPWFRSERLPHVYLPEELVMITALQQEWGVDGRCGNVGELTGDRLLWHGHTKTYSPIWQVPQFLLNGCHPLIQFRLQSQKELSDGVFVFLILLELTILVFHCISFNKSLTLIS